MKILTYLILGCFLTVVLVGVFILLKNPPVVQNLAGIQSLKTTYTKNSSYSSTTLSNGVATLIISKATSSRSYASVCFASSSQLNAVTSTVWIYKQATSTGVVVNLGFPLYQAINSVAATTIQNNPDSCKVFDVNDPYTNAVYAIANNTSTLLIETNQE